MLLGALVFGTAGYWAITAASRTGEVSVVSPFRYSRLIFAILLGYFVFAEPADVMTLIRRCPHHRVGPLFLHA